MGDKVISLYDTAAQSYFDQTDLGTVWFLVTRICTHWQMSCELSQL